MTHIESDSSAPASDSRKTWVRGLQMLLFIILMNVAQWILSLLAVLQFLWLLFTGQKNAFLARFGGQIGAWMKAVACFQGCASEDKPFPWAAWPETR